MFWKIITFILGLIPALIVWSVVSQFLALFLLWIIKILWFSDEVWSGLLGFSSMIIGILIVFLWWRLVFKKEQKKALSNSMKMANINPKTEKIKNIIAFLTGIIIFAIVSYLSAGFILIIIMFFCWTGGCHWADIARDGAWIFGLSFLIFIFYSYKIWLSIFNRENSEKISQKNISETEIEDLKTYSDEWKTWKEIEEDFLYNMYNKK